MTEEFRAAFQRVLDTAAQQASDFPAAVHDAFRLSSQVPVEELAIAMEALAPVLSHTESSAGIAADLAVLAGALVESGAPAGQVGLEVLRQLGRYGQAAVAFMHAWDKTGGGPLPEPGEVSEADEQRVEEVLGENAPLATVGWWTSLRYGLAAKAMLSDSEVRAAVRADSSALDGLTQIVHALSTQISEFVEVDELLRMAEVDTVLVLDRASGRGFRVQLDGVGDNFQLHTMLADALIGKEGRLVPGTRPDPRWTASCLDAPADPLADVVRGEWDLVGGDGTWVGNEACPRDVPVVDGERVLVLEPQSLSLSWRAGRRHPHIPGSLRVLEELGPEEAAAWWSRIHPAGAVRHPMAPPIEQEGPEAPPTPTPRHFGVAAHFAEVESGPISAAFQALEAEPEDEGSPEEPGTAFTEPPPRPSEDAYPEAPVPEPHPWTAEPLPPPPSAPPAPDDVPWPAALGEALRSSKFSPAHPTNTFQDPEPERSEPRPASGEGAAEAAAPAREQRFGTLPLPPMPPGVSDSWAWAPAWKWPMPPEPPR